MLFQQAALVVADVAKNREILGASSCRSSDLLRRIQAAGRLSWNRLSAVEGAFLRFRSDTA